MSFSAKSTHDLWVESRNISVVLTRGVGSITLDISLPAVRTVLDGFLVLLSESPITSISAPVDGTNYSAATASVSSSVTLGTAKAVYFSSNALAVNSTTPTTATISIQIAGTDDSTIYYAAAYGCSNVLQYYPLGVQSYPLVASRIETGISTYAGSIPTLPSAPTDPQPNFVYHDLGLNRVQYWTGKSWIPSRDDAILSGEVNPGILGHVFLKNGQMRVFNGSTWVDVVSGNMKIRMIGAWGNFASCSADVTTPKDPVVGDFFYSYTTQRLEYWDGGQWMPATSSNCLFNTGSSLVPAFTAALTIESTDLPLPYIGMLFYNKTSKALNVWTGTEWVKANTDQEGSPTTDKVAIGNDGSYEARVRLINVLKAQLGWPQVCVELTEEHFNIAIDNALDNLRMWTDSAYRRQFFIMQMIPNQQLYFLNSQTVGTDRIVDVIASHRSNILGVQSVSGMDAIWSSGIIAAFNQTNNIDQLSMHLVSAMGEDFNRIFAGDLTFVWNDASRELLFTRRISRAEKIIIETTIERSEQELLVDRWVKQFIQNWALAECKMQLGMIRSKYSSGTPGAAGSINLNGEMLVTEARQDMTELKQSALDYEWGGLNNSGNCSILIG